MLLYKCKAKSAPLRQDYVPKKFDKGHLGIRYFGFTLFPPAADVLTLEALKFISYLWVLPFYPVGDYRGRRPPLNIKRRRPKNCLLKFASTHACWYCCHKAMITVRIGKWWDIFSECKIYSSIKKTIIVIFLFIQISCFFKLYLIQIRLFDLKTWMIFLNKIHIKICIFYFYKMRFMLQKNYI